MTVYLAGVATVLALALVNRWTAPPDLQIPVVGALFFAFTWPLWAGVLVIIAAAGLVADVGEGR